jgi:hypothetical protein
MNFIQRFFCDYFGWFCPKTHRLSSHRRTSRRRITDKTVWMNQTDHFGGTRKYS